MQKRFVVLGTLECALTLVGGRAQASYNYSTAFVLSSPTSGVVINNALGTATLGGTVITFGPQAGNKAVPSLNSLNLGDVTVTSTGAAATFDVNFVDTVTITNVPLPGSALPLGSLSFSGTVNLVNVTGSTGTVLASNLTVTIPSTNAGGNTFSLSSPSFSSPTVNVPTAGGNVSAVINASTAVPAPASIVMLGLGMGAMGLVRFGRRSLAA